MLIRKYLYILYGYNNWRRMKAMFNHKNIHCIAYDVGWLVIFCIYIKCSKIYKYYKEYLYYYNACGSGFKNVIEFNINMDNYTVKQHDHFAYSTLEMELYYYIYKIIQQAIPKFCWIFCSLKLCCRSAATGEVVSQIKMKIICRYQSLPLDKLHSYFVD